MTLALLLLILSGTAAQADVARYEDELPALLDWKALAALNGQAAAVWAEMLDCSKGQTDLARTDYLRGKWRCPETAAETLRTHVRDFHTSVQQFLQSSYVVESDHRETVPRLVLEFKQSEAIHPFFVQSLYESLSLILKFSNLDEEVGPKKLWMIDDRLESLIHKHWLILRFAEPGPCVNWSFDANLAQSLDQGWFITNSRYVVPLTAYRYGSGSWMHSSWDHVSRKLRAACGPLEGRDLSSYLKWWKPVATLRKVALAHRK
jgi:hypothetical protein